MKTSFFKKSIIPANGSRCVVINESLENDSSCLTPKRLKRSRHLKIITMCMIIIGIMVPINSCQKENDSQPTETQMSGNKQKVNSPRKIALADATGAAVGAIIGTAVEPGGGTVVGAVVGGVGASIAAVFAKDVKVQRLAEADLPTVEIEEGAKNNDNPYDGVGKNHYLLMNKFLAEPKLYCSDNGYLSTDVYCENVGKLLSNIMDLPYIEIEHEGVQKCIDSREYSIIQVLPTYFNAELISILGKYEMVYEKSCNFEVFYEYSILAEEKVLKLTNCKDREKEIALSYMATLRWGAWYWDNIYFKD